MRYSKEDVEFLLQLEGYSLVSDYKNCKSKITIKCPKGHLMNISMKHFMTLDMRCNKCRKLYENKLTYYSKNNVNQIKNCCGVYCFINHTLKRVYVGETIRTFHIRWLNHFHKSKHNHKSDRLRYELVTHKDTEFCILTILEPNKDLTLKYEQLCIEWYKTHTDYTVLGGAWKPNKKMEVDNNDI